jgi:sensor histidine kinase regulating citrate/malate metabolism
MEKNAESKQKNRFQLLFVPFIVKAIVVEVGGKIWFESKENVGTTFFV